jgi:hypothetical protein
LEKKVMVKITKSSFLFGWQCVKRLYLSEKYKTLIHSIPTSSSQSFSTPNLSSGSSRAEDFVYRPEPPSEIQQEILSSGIQVGLYSRQLFPSGYDCQSNESLTQQALQNPEIEVLYEPYFSHHNLHISCDILTRSSSSPNHWNLFEVKSSTSVKDVHIIDGSFQYWVLRWCGLSIESVNIVHINSSYEKDGPLDPQKLFSSYNITEDAISYEEKITERLQDMSSCLEKIQKTGEGNGPKGEEEEEIPQVPVGKHCKKPYPCDFFKSCCAHAGIPPYSVMDLTNARTQQWKLLDCGVKSLKDIPNSFLKTLTHNQVIQVRVEQQQKPYYHMEALRSFLSKIRYPIHFLDFESFSSALPLFDGTTPYQAICFQYSLHTLLLSPSSSAPSPLPLSAADPVDPFHTSLLHQSYLADGTPSDPRHSFLLSLLSHLAPSPTSGHGQGSSPSPPGTILVYNKSYEANRLKELAKLFPEHLTEIQSLVQRMVDLADPFQSRAVVTPEMKGRYSIKAILPALVPSMAERYHELEISNGYSANAAYLRLLQRDGDGEEREEIRAHLLKYCELDTLAMVKILESLQTISHTKFSPGDLAQW